MTYDKQCWFCGKRSMVPKGDYFQCSECGATWNEPPSLGISPVTEVDNRTGGPPRPHKPTRYRPHGRLVHQVKREKEAASGKTETTNR